MVKNKFNDFLKKELINCEKLLKDTGAYDKVPEKRTSKQIVCYRHLSVIYRYFGEDEKAMKMFHHLTTFGSSTSNDRFYGLSEESKHKTSLLIQTGWHQLRNGVYFNLLNTDPEKATQLFEWAAENCSFAEKTLDEFLECEYYDEIAVAYVWRGYALLNLGSYEEAHELLTQVVPYLNKYKKGGIEMWRKVEYALPTALVPLCEYRLDPTRENLQYAQTGIEDYIKKLYEKRDKLDGYLYYFHLKETNADVYSVKVDKSDKPAAKRGRAKKPVKKLELPPGESDTEGSVIVFDMEGGYLDVFGTNNELEEYVEKVERLDGYPVLAGLMELYAMEGQQEPGVLIEECERLLLDPDADISIKEKTRVIHKAAKDAKKEGGTLMLYFDPEV